MLREEPPIRIAVVGGGFGGIYALKELDKLRASLNLPFEVILFEPRDNFVFTPLLHEVATAGLDLDHVTISYKHLFDKKPWLLHAKQKVSSINLTAKKIHAGGKEYRYDYLLLATGSTTNYYGKSSIAHNSMTLKTEKDAEKIRLSLEQALLNAAKASSFEKQEKLLSVNIIGGGPTGVELACEIVQFLHHRRRQLYKKIDPKAIDVHLFQGAPVVLPFASSRMQDAATKGLKRKGVTLITSAKVRAITDKFITYMHEGREHRIESHLTLWIAGIAPNVVKGFDGHYMVTEDLSLTRHHEAFAVGDAACYDPTCFLAPTPALAQVAVQEGIAAAQNIVRLINGRKTKPFVYKSKGFLISLGQKDAAAEINLPFATLFFKGFFAWWLWRTVYLMKFVDAKQRVKNVASWTGRLFTKRSFVKKKK
jgi:NADH dehydrogenase